MKPTKQTIKRRSAALESMASHLRETIDEAARQVESEQYANAFTLMRGIWPALVYCVHRRFHGISKARTRSTTSFITALSISGLDAAVVTEMQQADVAAVMGTATPNNVETLIAASVAALNATEPSKRRRRASTKAERKRPAIVRWASAAVGLFTFGN